MGRRTNYERRREALRAQVAEVRKESQRRHPGDWFIRYNDLFAARAMEEVERASVWKWAAVMGDPVTYRRVVTGEETGEITREEIVAVVETLWALWPGRIK